MTAPFTLSGAVREAKRGVEVRDAAAVRAPFDSGLRPPLRVNGGYINSLGRTR